MLRGRDPVKGMYFSAGAPDVRRVIERLVNIRKD